jgi:hypothetical protein
LAGRLIVVLLGLVATTALACGQSNDVASLPPAASRADEAVETAPVVSFKAPQGWFTAETSLRGPGATPVPIAWGANAPFLDDPAEADFPDATVRDLPPDGIVLEVVGPRPYSGEADFPHLSLPLELSDGYCVSDGYEGQPAPSVSACFIDAWINDGLVNITAWLGSNRATSQMIAAANLTLGTLAIDR